MRRLILDRRGEVRTWVYWFVQYILGCLFTGSILMLVYVLSERK